MTRPLSGSSNYGGAVTPQGVLKVLIVFAGFTNDVDVAAPDYYDINGRNPWPQEDGTHAPGLSFPKNVTADFYTSLASFQNNAVDRTLSNFYYQMSRHSANPFKMQAIFFPKRINVTATDFKNARPNGFFDYTNEVMEALKNDPDTRNFDFSQVDQRGARPNFNHDNSTTPPDRGIDYTVIIWRNPGTPFQTTVPNTRTQQGIAYTNAGWAAVPYTFDIPSANGQLYSTNGVGFTQAFGMSGLNQETFLHEFAHTLYNSPHYLAANRTVGTYFNLSEGPGMMGNLRTYFLANAWERWYNGWVELQTGANHANSDVQGAASLTATNGEFTLRDYVTTGDVMRIKLPNSSQYLWLENHQFASGIDGRANYFVNTRTSPQPLRGAPRGILAMVENVAGSRSDLLNQYDIGCNGMKVVSAQGNFDYTPSATSDTYNNYFFNYRLHDFTNRVANPFGGESQITRRRIDDDVSRNDTIFNDRGTGNEGTASEATTSFILNGAFEDGIFGPDVTFNTVGQKMGNSYNPAIFDQLQYDQGSGRLYTIGLGGLSVELIAKDANTGDITVKVRYDDVAIVQNTRWSGDLWMMDVAGAANGADVSVNAGKTLTINRSGTNNRHTKLAGAFINPTTFMCSGTGVQFLQNGGSNVNVEGANTAFRVKSGGELKLNPYGTTFAVKTGAVLDIQSGGTLTAGLATVLRVEAGGSLVVRNGGKLQGGGGTIQLQNGAYLCIEQGADLSANGLTLDVAPGVIIGTNPALNLGPLNCSTRLRFCGSLTGGNPTLSNICPTGNEALQFDGNDDVVTVPYAPYSPIHQLSQTFTVEATIRTDYPQGGTQTIFSNRYTDANDYVKGLLFTLYNGRYLLCQLEGYSYYSFSDPGMSLPASVGCHHIAVSRDATGRLRFYIDGVAAAYSPIAAQSPASTTNVCFGYDPNFPGEGFVGQVGEMRVWNVARSDAELDLYKAATLAVPQNGLVGYYDMQGTGGQYVNDASNIRYGGYSTPTGYLGSTDAVEANDPAWVRATALTCNVNGNFRPAPRQVQPDTTGQGRKQPFRNVRSSSPGKHLSQLTLSPNPASGEAVLHFQLRDAGPVTVSVQDLAGLARATVPLATTVAAGAHDVRLPLHGLQPGVYAVVVTSADGRQVIRLEVR